MERTSYRRIRWRRAWDDTSQALGARMRLAVVSAISGVVNACVIIYFTGKPGDMGVALYAGLVSIATVCATAATTLLGYLLWYFTKAPSRLYEEDQKKIAELGEMLKQHTEGLRDDFAQTFHDCAAARADLWSILDFASARLQATEVDIGSVRDSMKNVEFPEDILEIPRNGPLYDYAKNAVEGWGEGRREFLDFCLSLYRQDKSSLLNRREWESLDGYRRDLSKFWNDWGIRCSRLSLPIGDIVSPDIIQSQTPDVVMLTYLEVARGFHWKENSRGKQGLFGIARNFRESSNLL